MEIINKIYTNMFYLILFLNYSEFYARIILLKVVELILLFIKRSQIFWILCKECPLIVSKYSVKILENFQKIQIISGKMEKVKKSIVKHFQTYVCMHHFEDK